MSDNLAQVYNYVNRKLSCKGGVGLLKDDKGVITDNSQLIASILNEYFNTLFSRDNGQMPITAISRCADTDKLKQCKNLYFNKKFVIIYKFTIQQLITSSFTFYFTNVWSVGL